MPTPWFVTSWKYNFNGSIGSNKSNDRCVAFVYVFFICVMFGTLIAWLAITDKTLKAVLFVNFVCVSVPITWISVIYGIYYGSRLGYSWYYKYIRKQRKRMVVNEMDLRNTLMAFRDQVPNMEQSERIEERSRRYLQNIQTLIDENLDTDTEMMLTGSAAERYGVPFTSLQKNYETSNDCVSQFTFCCQESLQSQELVRLHDLKHAILSDCDCMVSPNNEMVSFNNDGEQRQRYKAVVKEFPFYIIADEENVQFHSKKLKKDLLDMVEKLDVKKSIPWDLSGDEEHKNFFELYINGPAITLKLGSTESQCQMINMNFYGDITYSLKCPQWPDICDWGRRPNTEQPDTEQPKMKWPRPEEMERIKSFGCHFVPKSHPNDPGEITWRISFSKAEVELSKLVPEAARLCLIGLKVIAKDYLGVACKKFKSYHLKCIFLHTLEITEPSIWYEENLEFCFNLLLRSLRICLQKEIVQNFWLSTENLLKDFTRKDFQRLLEQLTRVEENPSRFIEPLNQGNPIEYEETGILNNIDEFEPIEYEPIVGNISEMDVLVQ